MLGHKAAKLFIQPVIQIVCSYRKMQVFDLAHTEHSVKSFLQTSIVVLQSKIKNRAFTSGVIPKRCTRTDVIRKLSHKKAFAELRSTYKEVGARVQNPIN